MRRVRLGDYGLVSLVAHNRFSSFANIPIPPQFRPLFTKVRQISDRWPPLLLLSSICFPSTSSFVFSRDCELSFPDSKELSTVFSWFQVNCQLSLPDSEYYFFLFKCCLTLRCCLFARPMKFSASSCKTTFLLCPVLSSSLERLSSLHWHIIR